MLLFRCGCWRCRFCTSLSVYIRTHTYIYEQYKNNIDYTIFVFFFFSMFVCKTGFQLESDVWAWACIRIYKYHIIHLWVSRGKHEPNGNSSTIFRILIDREGRVAIHATIYSTYIYIHHLPFNPFGVASWNNVRCAEVNIENNDAKKIKNEQKINTYTTSSILSAASFWQAIRTETPNFNRENSKMWKSRKAQMVTTRKLQYFPPFNTNNSLIIACSTNNIQSIRHLSNTVNFSSNMNVHKAVND